MFSVFREYLSAKIRLSDEDYRMIESVCIFKKLRKRQYLAQEGDIWRYNAFVCQGLLRTYRVDDKGVEHIMNFAMENWWIGDRESLASGNPSGFNIDALEDSVVLLINKENFDHLCKKLPALNDLVHTIINNSFIASQKRINAFLSYTAEEKYIYFRDKYPGFALRVPQQMVASYLGMTPESLSRIKRQISKK